MKTNSFLPSLNLFLALISFCAFGQAVADDFTPVVDIKRHFENGRLVLVETSNGIFYQEGEGPSYAVRDRTPDSDISKRARERKRSRGHLPPEIDAYKVHHSMFDFYFLKDFLYEGISTIRVDEGALFLGHCKIGYIEAVIFPIHRFPFSYSDKEDAEINVSGVIDFVYIRFQPEDMASLFRGNIYHWRDRGPFSEETREERYVRFLKIRKPLFQKQAQGGGDVIYNSGLTAFWLKMRNKDAYYNEYSDSRMHRADVYSLNPDGGLKRRGRPLTLGTMHLKPIWEKYSDGLFNVYYPKDSVIKPDVVGWLRPRKQAFGEIRDYFGIAWDFGKIDFYVFNDRKQGQKIGLKLGFANPSAGEVYTLHNQTYGHELTHVISYRIGSGQRIKSALINEGLATWLSMRTPEVNYHRMAKAYLDIKNQDECDLRNESFRKCRFGYFLGASFVGWLMETNGLDLFKAFFSQEDHSESESFELFYGKSYEILNAEWQDSLSSKEWGELTAKERGYLDRVTDKQ